ncbi:MAG TPA: DUF3597 domain-containing protein [Anaerolineales bacterium]|nr:DUF3597 domain-containing protein [Anaerolineales bacterium]
MSLFSKILDKLGLRKDKEEEKPASTRTSPKTTTPAKPGTSKPTMGTSTRTTIPGQGAKDDVARQPGGRVATTAPPPKAMSEVDVMNMLEVKAKGTGLNWKQSISDLLFLLDIDNSYDARVELAKELNAPQEVMGDSARMNTWLHKEVMRKIAANGGNIPQELLD